MVLTLGEIGAAVTATSDAVGWRTVESLDGWRTMESQVCGGALAEALDVPVAVDFRDDVIGRDLDILAGEAAE